MAPGLCSQRSLSQRLRIDPILLVLLLILSGVGLAVLYSANDDSAVVLRRDCPSPLW